LMLLSWLRTGSEVRTKLASLCDPAVLSHSAVVF
jgi:hypothetical protein